MHKESTPAGDALPPGNEGRATRDPSHIGGRSHAVRSHSSRLSVRFRLAGYGVAALSILAATGVFLQGLPRLRKPLSGDFGVFYAAGRLAAAGRPGAAYSTASLDRVEAALNHGRDLHLIFPYPPYVTWFFGLAARLPAPTAFELWSAANILGYLAAAVLVLSRIERGWRPLVAALLAGCTPLVVSVAQGENGGVVALAFTLTLCGLMESSEPATPNSARHGGEAGAARSQTMRPILLLGLGLLLLTLKPQFLPVPLVVVAIRRRPVEILAACAALLAPLLVGLATAGVAGYNQFFDLILGGLGTGTRFRWSSSFNYTLQAQAQSFLGRGLLSTIVWTAVAGVLLGLLARAASRRLVPPAIMAAVAILVSSHAMFHDLALLLPALTMAIPIPRLRWSSLGVALTIIVDPLLYGASHVHMLVFGLLVVAAVGLISDGWAYEARTMGRDHWSGARIGSWRLFVPPRWGSASGSETP